MKIRKTAVLAALLSLVIPLLAAETAVSLSVSPGVTFGQSTEYVYEDGYVLSRLDWPLYPAWTGSVAASARFRYGLALDARLSAGIPLGCGTVSDSDFMNIPDSEEKTHLSVHDGYLQHAIDAEIRAGWAFDEAYGPGIALWAGCRYLRYKWLARDGYCQYPSESYAPYTPWSEDEYKTPVYGPALMYEQEFIVPLIGFSVSWQASRALLLRAGCGFTPWLYAADQDNHLLTRTDYYDFMDGGFCFTPELSALWRFSETTGVFLSAEGIFINGVKGYTVQVDDDSGNSGKTSGDTAGAALNAGTIRLGVETRLR